MNSSETKTAPPIIELSHVDKHFGQLHVLKDISLSVKKGEVVVIIGPSGSGKGTIIKSLLQQREDTVLSISVTTRDPRPGEEAARHLADKFPD